MRCPVCEAQDTRVIDSRLLNEGQSIRRRRKCDKCNRRFTTYEKLEIPLPVIVKNDARRENYDREKIIKSIKKACHKSQIPMSKIEELIDGVEKALMEEGEKEIPSRRIGEIVMTFLFKLDPVAYVRFASFYWRYKDITDFMSVLQKSLREMNDNRFEKQTGEKK